MKTTKIFLLTFTTLIIVFVSLITVQIMNKSKAKYDIFKDNQELFVTVKDDIHSLVNNKIDNPLNGEDHHVYIFHHDGAVNTDGRRNTHINGPIKRNLERILALSPLKFDKVRYELYNGEPIVSFIFDWERVRGNTYSMDYCESYEAIVGKYNDMNIDFKIHKLGGHWYGVELKTPRFFFG